MEKLYSIEEAAKALGGISKYTIQQWMSIGKLKRTKIGSRTMVRESDLVKMIDVGGKLDNWKKRRKNPPAKVSIEISD